MNRDQMINHLTLTGWMPVESKGFWIGVASVGRGLVFLYESGGVALHVGNWNDGDAAIFECRWDRIGFYRLKKLFDYAAMGRI